MASSTTTSTGKSYLFNGPGDFEAWSISFHNRTKRLLLKPYIDNGEDVALIPWPEAPTYPDFANFPKRLVMPHNLRSRNNNAAAGSSQGSSIKTSTQGGDDATGSQTPAPGTVQGSHHNLDEESIDIHYRATALSQLTTLRKEDYKAAVARHSARTKEWERITTNSNALA